MQRYAITAGAAVPNRTHALVQQIRAWVAGGIEYVQLREKDFVPAELEALTQELAALTQGTGTRLLVNGMDARVATRLGAAGVHLRSGATAQDIHAARQAAACVSVSCHNAADLEQARRGEATLIVWAPVFEKIVDDIAVQTGTGLAALACCCARVRPIPVFALGGVNVTNLGQCIAAGAAGVAGIRLFSGSAWQRFQW